MAWLQFLSGERADDFVELNPTATLIIGSAPDAHIQLRDPEIAPQHCQVYPAQGAYWLRDLGQGMTVHGLHRLVQETEGLRDHDVFILGRTFVRFCAQPPRGASGGSGAGADPAALEAAQRELAALRAEVDRLRAWGSKGEELTESLSEKLREAKERLEKARRQLNERDEEIERLRAERGAADKESARLEERLSEAVGELRELRGKSAELEAALEEKERALEASRKERETARVDAKRLAVELDLLERRSAEAVEETRVGAEERLAEERRRAELLAERLAAAEEALTRLGVAPTAPVASTPLASKGWRALLEEFPLDPPLRAALEEAISAAVEAEALRRYAGPDLRWDDPASAEQVQRARALRQRGERVALALALEQEPDA
ncbi:MAG: FHA domain-containing protein [Planctomycetota bacterium]|nr:MAG: FHA domain-containing protein [Planctomycetota bacterium]